MSYMAVGMTEDEAYEKGLKGTATAADLKSFEPKSIWDSKALLLKAKYQEGVKKREATAEGMKRAADEQRKAAGTSTITRDQRTPPPALPASRLPLLIGGAAVAALAAYFVFRKKSAS